MSFKALSFLNSKQKNAEQQLSPSNSFAQKPVELAKQFPPDELDELDANASSDSRHWSDSSIVAALVKLLPLGTSVFTLLYLFHLGGEIANIRNNHNQVLIQTINGHSILAEPVDNYVRTPVTVEQTVNDWRDLTFNWVQKLPDGKKDEGKQLGGKAFPTRLLEGSTLMSYDVQQVWYKVFLEREDYLPSNFLQRNATRVFYPLLQTQPRSPLDSRAGQPIPNRYEVEVHGDWVEYSPETPPQGKLIDRIHLLVRLRPVVKTEPPLSQDADLLQRVAYELRANGLEIYDIQRINKHGP